MRCSALLLAGGRSSRMGRDKALLEFDGEPLWRHQLATLRRLGLEQLLISGPFPDEGCETVADFFAGSGPLAGVDAALQKCSSPLLLVLAVDLPRMTSDFLRSLLALSSPGHGVVPRHGEYFEPLAAVYPKRAAPLARAALAAGRFSLQDFVREAIAEGLLSARPLEEDEAALFHNLNSPADL